MEKNLQNILGSIDELANRGGISRNRAFAAWYAITFFDLDEDEALEAAEADGGNDQGIDLVFADASSQEIVVIQAHCPGNHSKVTPKEKWDAVVASLAYIKNPESLKKEGRLDIAENIENLINAHPTFSFTVGLISLGLRHDKIERAVTAQQNIQNSPASSFFYLAQEDITSKFKSLVEAESGIPEDQIKFDGSYFEDTGEYGRAWIGSITSNELINLFNKHENKLFAGNVRLFLGSRKGGINEQIIATAKENPGQFWALNNGITIVADHVVPDEKNNSLTLKRFSIVNGCQTTSCLVQAGETKAKVLARIISAKTGLKNEIVRYNNSQNAVKIWAVRAADHIQEELRREFQLCDITYAPKQEGTRKKHSPLLIELDKVTQYLASREQHYLIQAINNKSELFDEPYQKIFKQGTKAKTVYLAWLLGSIADATRQERVKELKADSGDDPNVGLLGIAGAYWIVYCAYKLIDNFSDINSAQITLQKMKTEQFSGAVKKYIYAAIDLFYESAIDTYDRDEYGSFKSTLRSTKFLQKFDSKVNNKISRMKKEGKRPFGDLAATAKSIKI
jgi:hypothetical protein